MLDIFEMNKVCKSSSFAHSLIWVACCRMPFKRWHKWDTAIVKVAAVASQDAKEVEASMPRLFLMPIELACILLFYATLYQCQSAHRDTRNIGF